MKYFAADLHLGHSNIIKYCHRPYENVEEMDHRILRNFQAVLKPGDELYILGDLSFQLDKAVHFLSYLHCQKFMVWGNHDPKKTKEREVLSKMFVKTADVMETKLASGKSVVMCHYPLLRWNKGHFGSFMLHGHTHGGCKYPDNMRILDVGVDNDINVGGFNRAKYFPISEREVDIYMKGIPWMENHYFNEHLASEEGPQNGTR